MTDNLSEKIVKDILDVTSAIFSGFGGIPLPVKICSNHFPRNILRMAGVQNPQHKDSGFGAVNVQYEMDDPDRNMWEAFFVHKNEDGSFSIESVAFPKNYLRMDAKDPGSIKGRFGKVNCQADIGSYEKFQFHKVGVGPGGEFFSIESVAFPGNYLMLDGTMNPSISGSGFGAIGCQSYASDWEMFYFKPFTGQVPGMR